MKKAIFLICSTLFFLTVLVAYCSPLYSQDTTPLPSVADDTIKANIYVQRADSLVKLNVYDSAAFYFIKAREIFKKARMWDRLQYCTTKISYAYSDLNMDDKAIEILDSTIKTYSTASPPHSLGIFDCLNTKAETYFFLSQFEKSLEILEKSFDIPVPTQKEEFSKYEKLLAESYFIFGNNYSVLGKLDLALEKYEQTLNIRKKYYDEHHPGIGNCYSTIGIVYNQLGDYMSAIKYELKCLSIRKKHYGINNANTALSYNNLGILYNDIGDYEKALKSHFEALNIRKKVLPEKHRNIGASYLNIANVYANMENYIKVMEYEFKALEHYQSAFGDDNIELIGIYNNIGSSYHSQKKFDKAIEFFKKAEKLSLAHNPDNKSSRMLHNQNIAEAFYNKQEFDSVFIYLNKAIDASNFQLGKTIDIRSIPLFEVLLNSLLLKGKLHFSEFVIGGNTDLLKLSIDTYLGTLELMECIRNSYLAEVSKLVFSKEYSEINCDAINTIHVLNKETNADSLCNVLFDVIERSKTTVLHEMLNKSHAIEFANIPDSLIAKEKNLSSKIHSKKIDVNRLEEKHDSILTDEISNLHDQLFALETNYNKLIDQLEQDYPLYKQLKLTPEIPSPNVISNQLDDETALLNYFVADTSLFIYVITADTSNYVHVPVDAVLEDKVSGYLKCIRKNRHNEFSELSSNLYETLLKPVKHFIDNKQSLVIVPDKYLCYLPFETLICGEDEHGYLIEKYDINYHYSATLFSQTRSRTNEVSANNGFIGFAPVFNSDSTNCIITPNRSTVIDSTIAGYDAFRFVSVDGKTYNELTHSEEELKSIVKMFRKNRQKADALFHSQAGEEEFISRAGNYKYIHLATHGFINEENPNLSGIVFSQKTDSVNVFGGDNILFAGEVYNLSLNADLVVLSACETGIGKVINGEGIMSMTRGFIYAGAPNIVVSLWKVGDKNTCELMKSFYHYILEGNSYSAALRKSKLEFIKNQAVAFPSNWAGFTLIGGD